MKYIVYVRTDEFGYITEVSSSAFLPDCTGWTEIDRGTGDRYHHAQGNYFSLPIITDGGAYRYKLANGRPVECGAAEIEEQEAALQPGEPEKNDGTSVWDELDAAYQEGVDSV